MRLELGKTYRCRNGCTIRVEGIDGNNTAYCSVDNGQNGQMRFIADSGYPRYADSGYEAIALAEPELMFSFRRSPPEHSVTVSESKLREYIKDARNYGGFTTICDAAERMIEMAKAPKPVALPRLNPTISIRRQIAEMLEEIGLEPTRFLNNPEKDIKPMCQTKQVSNITPKEASEHAARQLINLMNKDGLSINATPLILRLWLNDRWDEVAKIAHKIHNGET